MQQFIKQVFICDQQSKHHGKTCDVHIEDGFIKAIAPQLTPLDGAQIIDIEDAWLSPGWVDMNISIPDPGYEHRETMESGLRAAAAGGFTHVLYAPYTKPAIDNKSTLRYITAQSSAPVTCIPAACVSQGIKGKDLAEMYDLHLSGATFFTDGPHAMLSAGLTERALQYVKRFDGVIGSFPIDRTIAPDAMLNEGRVSVAMGLPGLPTMAEELLVHRDIQLAAYTQSRLHFMCVTTAGSVELIRRAKKEGIGVTASVNAYHLLYTDEDINHFDSAYKVWPPLRSETDKQALMEGVLDGTIDAISSGHDPQHADDKRKPFADAAFGISAVETAFAMACTASKEAKAPLENVISCFTMGPRQILGLEKNAIEVGQKACLTLFQPNAEQEVDTASFYSLSKTNPANGQRLNGKVHSIYA